MQIILKLYSPLQVNQITHEFKTTIYFDWSVTTCKLDLLCHFTDMQLLIIIKVSIKAIKPQQEYINDHYVKHKVPEYLWNSCSSSANQITAAEPCRNLEVYRKLDALVMSSYFRTFVRKHRTSRGHLSASIGLLADILFKYSASVVCPQGIRRRFAALRPAPTPPLFYYFNYS